MHRASDTRFAPAIVLFICLLAGMAAGQYVEDSIDVGQWSPGAVAHNSDADVVYFAGQYDGYLAADCATNLVIYRVDSLRSPAGLYYDSVDHKAIFSFSPESLMIIDGATHRRRGAFYVPELDLATGVWAADNDRLYFPLSGEDIDSIVVIDCAGESVVGRIGVSAEHTIVGLNLGFDKLYVGDWDSTMLWIIDRRTNQVSRRLQLRSPQEMSLYSEAHRRFFFNTGNINVIDGETDNVLGVVDLPGTPRALAEVSEDGRLVVACSFVSCPIDTVYTLDMYTFEVLARIPVGNTPQQLLRSPETGLIYCRDFRDTISVISSDGMSLVARLGVGHTPGDMVLSSRSRRLYSYCNDPGGLIYVIRDTVGPPGVDDARSGLGQASLMALPNPFSYSVRFAFAVGPACAVRIYAPDGRLVRVLSDVEPGRPTAVWDGHDEAGKEVPPGVYTAIAGRGTEDRIRVVKAR